jgi:hypothetical protein
MASLKQKVKDLASEIKGEDENFEIKRIHCFGSHAKT